MNYINSTQLESVLGALGEQLLSAGDVAHLVVIGGSGLLAIGAVARATQDVDVVALVQDGVLRTAEPLPSGVVRAAQLVARDFRLPAAWLNAGPTPLLELGGLPEGFAERVVRRSYGPALTVDFASRFDQIHLKLLACVGRGEPRDRADLRSLDPSPAELTVAASWTHTHNAPGPFDDELRTVLGEFGVDDVDREH